MTNQGTNASRPDIAIRFVENDSFAMVGTLSLEPGETRTLDITLPTYDDEPAHLTVQLRIDGEIVAERPAKG